MEKLALHSCCFIGHRRIAKTAKLTNDLRRIIEDFILNKSVNTFFFGSRSEFDKLCYEIVSDLKLSYPTIRRIYVRAEYPLIDNDYKSYLLKYYEETYFPQKIEKAEKAVYIERNYEMIDRCAYCIIYYDENYLPSITGSTKRRSAGKKLQSGTQLAYNYARQKKLYVHNVFNYKL